MNLREVLPKHMAIMVALFAVLDIWQDETGVVIPTAALFADLEELARIIAQGNLDDLSDIAYALLSNRLRPAKLARNYFGNLDRPHN